MYYKYEDNLDKVIKIFYQTIRRSIIMKNFFETNYISLIGTSFLIFLKHGCFARNEASADQKSREEVLRNWPELHSPSMQNEVIAASTNSFDV